MLENSDDLIKLATEKMPFGRYAGTILVDLPEPYVVWFNNNDLPPGELGRLLALLYEIKLNGLEYLFKPLKASYSKHP
ncbi:MAG: DUF3820 family protein [Bdellovibrionaceae bacterium]|nr:DUF3820 family protein [Pseudobdellovibrionaceae bacterium]